MKPENKLVAAVVLLGIVLVAAVAVLVKAPRWKQKAKERHQESILAHLTPEQAIALCGKPILDETQAGKGDGDKGTFTRRLVVRNDYSLAVELDFAATSDEPKRWRLTAIQDPSGEIKYETPAIEIGVLPCLDEKQGKKQEKKQE